MDVHTIHWRADKLRKIAETDDLHISPFREDGVTELSAKLAELTGVTLF